MRAIRYSHGRTLIGAVVGHQRVEGGGEDLLQHVLGVLARAEHVAAEGQQARLVARDQRLVGGLVAAPGQRDEALVALEAQQRRRAAKAVGVGMGEGRGFHARRRTGSRGNTRNGHKVAQSRLAGSRPSRS